MFVETKESWDNVEISSSEANKFTKDQVFVHSETLPTEKGLFFKWDYDGDIGFVYGADGYGICGGEFTVWEEALPDNYADYIYIEKSSSYRLCEVRNIVGTDYAIAETYDGAFGNLPVTRIDSMVFENCNNLQNLTIPTSVIKICTYAFRGCTDLNVTYLGTKEQWEYIVKEESWRYGNAENVFDVVHCSDGDIEYSSSTSKSYNLNYEYDAATDSYIVIGVNDSYWKWDGVMSIPYYYNDGLYGVKPVRSIKDEAFKDNKKITMLIIAANIEEIGVGAFENCVNLMYVCFVSNSKMQVLSERVFAGCGALQEIYFGQNNSLSTIKTDAFNGCAELSTIELSSITKIEDDAFCGCSISTAYVGADEDWNSIEISESEKSVFSKAQIYFYSENEPEERGFFWKWDKNRFGFDDSEWRDPSLWLEYYPYGHTTYYYIEKTSSYGLGRVYNLTGTEYSVSETYDGSYGNLPVTEISSNAFYNSSSVSSIIIPTSVVSIKSEAFSGLTNVTITYLGTKAKWEYEVKKAIGWKIGCEINSIIHCSDGDYTMEEEVTIDVEDCPIITSDTGICYAYYAPLDGYVVTGLYRWDYSVIIDGSNGCLYLPEKFDDGTHGEKAVVAIKERSFAANKNIRRVIIPASVKYIGYRAFYNCNRLYYVIFADDSELTTLSESAFEGCKTLAGVSFGKGSKLQKIKSNAFAGGLIAQIFLPKTLKGIAADAFGDDAAIDIVFYEGTQADWQNVIMSDEYRQKFAKTEFAYYLADQSSEEEGLFWTIEGTRTIGDSVISNVTPLPPKGYIMYERGVLIFELYYLEEETGGKAPELYYEIAKGYWAFIQTGGLGESELSDSYVIPEKRDGWCGELSVTALSADFSAATESISLTVPVTIKYIVMKFGENGATVTYLGTMSQWHAIEKQINIGSSVTIHCSDGDIEI